jgi:glutathione synthase
MTKHIFFINSLADLNIKKDSSLLMMLSFKQLGLKVYALFEEDFYIRNDQAVTFDLYEVEGEIAANFYLKNFELKKKAMLPLQAGDVIHMRIDPPYDARYQRYLWMLNFFKADGIKVMNEPIGIMQYNEKLTAYRLKNNALTSYVGASVTGLELFLAKLEKENVTELVMKPLDLFSGIGVIKCANQRKIALKNFNKMTSEYGGAIVVQPYLPEVTKGELRAIFYRGKHLGSIVKYPKRGDFISNIAQGASFEVAELPLNLNDQCQEIAWELKEVGVDLVAFDLLGNYVTEVNVTCPGLIVEVSSAHKRNLALEIGQHFL